MNNICKIEHLDRIIIFGSGNLIIDFIQECENRHIDTHLFSVKRQLDEIYDADLKLTFRELLDKNGIKYYEVDDINTSNELKSLVTKSTIGIGMGETYIFSKEMINLFDYKLFDVMIIRLPQYRGGAHFTWQILRKNNIGCVNLQVINEDMIPGVFDSGKIIKSRDFIIPKNARIPNDFFKVYAQETLMLLKEFLDAIKEDKEFSLSKPQDNFSLYLPRLYTLKHGFINWGWTTEEIEQFICAFDNPYAGASTFISGQKVFLKNCQTDYTEGQFHPFINGIIYRICNDAVYVASRQGSLILKTIIDENGVNIIPKLKPGMRFYTPTEQLDKAMMFSAEYDSKGLVED